MKLLAFDTSTEALSVAVAHGDAVHAHSGAGGAQASATLIPTVRALMAQAGLAFEALDAIAFGAGPGSFTGLRTACSVAQGLAFGAGAHRAVPVLPVDTLLAVAEEARARFGVTRVLAALDARMDEIYAARYVFDSDKWLLDGRLELISPENLGWEPGWALAGNAWPAYGARLGRPQPQSQPVCEVLPTAAALLRLAPALLAAGHGVSAAAALPHYIRDKVAKTTEERAAEKQAAAVQPPAP